MIPESSDEIMEKNKHYAMEEFKEKISYLIMKCGNLNAAI